MKNAMILIVILMAGILFANNNIAAEENGIIFPDEVLVERGSFIMGDQSGEMWYGCRPAHQVTFTYDYFLGKYEVTFDEYDTFCDATGREYKEDDEWGRGKMPVLYVSWYEAVEYCNWLSELGGFAPSYDKNGDLLDSEGNITTDITQVQGYRLPTEAEWEFAANGGNLTNGFIHSGSNDLDEVAWYWKNSGDESLDGRWQQKKLDNNNCRTHEVGGKKPNELGLYDMTGNLSEWCSDYWSPYTKEDRINPINPASTSYIPIRGASWRDIKKICLIQDRHRNYKEDKFNLIGFRVARTNQE